MNEPLKVISRRRSIRSYQAEQIKGEEYKNKLGIPEGYSPVCAVALGYKAVDNVPTPPRKNDVISFIKKG